MRVFSLAAIAAAQDAVNLAVQAPSNANRPVAKVINLLNEMATQVTKEKNSDEELHEKMDCWCKTNKAEKTAAIADAERRIGELQSLIEENVALEAQLKTEIANLATEITNKGKSLAQATEMRDKEHAEFAATHEETVATLEALANAIGALKKHHGDNGETFLQVKNALATRLPNTAFAQKMQQDLWAVLGSATEEKTQKLSPAELLQAIFAAPKEGFLQQPTGAVAGVKSYNSRSGEIFGILNQMHDDFTRDDKEAVDAEATALAAFQKLSKALKDGIASATDSKKAKEASMAAAQDTIAKSRADLKSTQDALGADSTFLAQMTERCATSDNEYMARQAERQTELQAISEAVQILTSDESRDLFSRTFSFVQTKAAAKVSAEAKLLRVARKHNNVALAQLAVSVKLDAFTKVKAAMDEMLANLAAQQKDEVAHREFCLAELDKNEDSIKENTLLKGDLETNIESLTGTIEQLSAEIKTLEEEIAAQQTELKKAGEDRAAENSEFQTTVADQRATQMVLQKALDRLREFYAPEQLATQAPALLQEPGQPSSAAPPKAAAYEKSAGASGVLTIIQMVIKDAQALERQAMKDEQAAQTAYAEFVSSTNASVKAKQQAISSKTGQRGQAETNKAAAEGQLDATVTELGKLADMNKALHTSCDFVLHNFEGRQEARQQEMDAINDAKAVLSGANFA